MKLVKIKQGVEINILYREDLMKCVSSSDIVNKLYTFTTTKDQIFDNSEFFDYVRYINISSGQSSTDPTWPTKLQKIYENINFMQEFYILRKGHFYAFVHRSNIEVLN